MSVIVTTGTAAGATGPTGPAGATGVSSPGPAGATGAVGATGATGPATTGATGAVGATGPATLGISSQAGTSYTLALGDAGSTILFTNGSAVSVTVPTNASVAYPVGTEIFLQQTTSGGQVGVFAASGVTVNAAGNFSHTAQQWSVTALLKTGTNTWAFTGDRA